MTTIFTQNSNFFHPGPFWLKMFVFFEICLVLPKRLHQNLWWGKLGRQVAIFWLKKELSMVHGTLNGLHVCVNELKFCKVSRNPKSNSCWKFQPSILTNKKVLFLKKNWCVPCTMDSSFFSQKMPYYLLTILVYMALGYITVIIASPWLRIQISVK